MLRLTNGLANDQLLYFTSPSLTADGRTLVFISDRDGVDKPNLFSLDLHSQVVTRLSDNTHGRLRSYVYFDGHHGRGLGLASPSLHAPSGNLYFIQNDEIRVADSRTGRGRVIARILPDDMTAFTHVSDDGRLLCVPTIERRAFDHDGRTEDYDGRVQSLGLVSRIRVFDTESGAQVLDIPVERGWVTHVQFRPGRPEQILFNHEWCTQSGIRRAWLWDGTSIRRLRTESPRIGIQPARCRNDWVCHEVWTHDGRHVIYHGAFAATDQGGDPQLGGHQYIARLDPDRPDEPPIEIAFERSFQKYGHFTASPRSARLVTDGYFQNADDAHTRWGGKWISLFTPDWQTRTLAWQPLCAHDSSWKSQDAHPHPVFAHDDSQILFTSDTTGRRAVYGQAIGRVRE